jgi:hypothetical protein
MGGAMASLIPVSFALTGNIYSEYFDGVMLVGVVFFYWVWLWLITMPFLS